MLSSAENNETTDKVAIKKISRAFEDTVDAKRILREIKLLQHFDHENVITIVDLLPPASMTQFDDVYIITDLMETDLHRIIYSQQPLTDDHIQYFLYQVFSIIHCCLDLHLSLSFCRFYELLNIFIRRMYCIEISNPRIYYSIPIVI